MASIITISGGFALDVQQGIIGIGQNLPLPAVWYDFSDITTLFQDDAKTTPVTTNGDPIGAVEDKTGNGQDLTQSNASNKPVYTTNVQNGLSVADTDPTGNALWVDRVTASWTTIPRPYTIYAVGRTPATVVGSFTRAFVYATDTGSGTMMVGLAPTVTNGGTWRYRSSSAGVDSVTYPNFAAVGANTWYITTMVVPAAGDVVIYQNNVNDPVASLTGQDYIRGCRLGHDRNLGGKNSGCWRGMMGEVRIYPFDADADGVNTTIYNDLASKWGL